MATVFYCQFFPLSIKMLAFEIPHPLVFSNDLNFVNLWGGNAWIYNNLETKFCNLFFYYCNPVFLLIYFIISYNYY